MAVETSSENDNWPMLDFSLFPDEMISGLTLPEINEYMNNGVSHKSFLEDLQEDTLLNFNQISTDGPSTSTSKQFAPPVDDTTLTTLQLNSIPKGTKNINSWACNLYSQWHSQRTIENGDDLCIPLPSPYQLAHATDRQINYWISKFIYEIRKKDGSMYPRSTLIALVAGLNSLLQKNDENIYRNLFKDKEFNQFRDILDLACKEATKSGVGCQSKQAQVITESEEELLWANKHLGGHSPVSLVNSLLYLNGLHFALRSGQEHRDLTIDQIQIIPHNSISKYFILEYTETVSKTNNGGFKHRKLQPKKVRHIDINSVENVERSHALLLQKYLSLRPQNASNVFYLTPLAIKNDSVLPSIWYKTTPMGHNTLSKVVKNMCSKSGISGHITNHSLRATCATRLYESGVDEQVIMERTGHRSTKGVRGYKRTSDVHHFNSSLVLDNRQNLTDINKLVTNNSSKTNSINFHFHAGCNVVINN